MRCWIIVSVVLVILLSISYVYLYEKDGSRVELVFIEDISFIYFRTNETNTKGVLSFCLCDDSEQFVTAQIERTDSGNIHICLWRGDDVYKDIDQNKLIPKSPIPGLTQSIVKEGKKVEDNVIISGFNMVFDMNSSTSENYVIIGGERISLKDRGVLYKALGAPRFITSWPINLN